MTVVPLAPFGDVEDSLGRLRTEASAKLDLQATRARMYQDYYDGDMPILAIMDDEERRSFRDFMRESSTNWCELIVNAPAERMEPTGFDFGDEDGSDLAWDLWAGNQMDADGDLVITSALTCGHSFVMVQPGDLGVEGVEITAESAQEATVLYEPGSRTRRRAGYKRWQEPGQEVRHEWLITPEWIAEWHGTEAIDWRPNPTGTVHLVEVTPQPRLEAGRWPRSELKPALSIQDRINTTIYARMVVIDKGAYQQRWAKGVKLMREALLDGEGQPELDGDGKPRVKLRPPFRAGIDHLWIAENEQAGFGAIPGTDPSGYLASVTQDTDQMAAVNQTPAWYLTGTVANLSAEAITALEAGLIAKIRRRTRQTSKGLTEVERIALRLAGADEQVFGYARAGVTWRDFQTRSLAQLTDSLVKMGTLGVPRRVLWELYGATQTQADRWEQLADEQEARTAATFGVPPEAAYGALLNAAAGPAPGPGPGPAPG
jgi:hypothetical protein